MHYSNYMLSLIYLGGPMLIAVLLKLLKLARTSKKDSLKEANDTYQRSRSVAMYQERNVSTHIKGLENSIRMKEKENASLKRELERYEKSK